MKSSEKNDQPNQHRKSKAQLEKELLKTKAELQKKNEEVMEIKGQCYQAGSASELWEKINLIEEELKKAKVEIEDLKQFKKQMVGLKKELEEKLTLYEKSQEVLRAEVKKIYASADKFPVEAKARVASSATYRIQVI